MSNELEEIRSLLNDIKARLVKLQDTRDIEQVIVSYARGCDRGNDPAIIGPLFGEDGTWECKGFGRYEGRRRVAMGLKGIAGEKIWWSLHYMISPLIRIDAGGNNATAFWYLWESATVPNPATDEAQAHFIGGTYDTVLHKQDDGRWLFKSMQLNINMVSPYESGWVKAKYLSGSRTSPYLMDLDAGTYHWCACGRSKNQPFCDGSHKETRRVPIEFTLKDREHVALCGCKYSKTKPHCDGSHLKLKLDEEQPS